MRSSPDGRHRERGVGLPEAVSSAASWLRISKVGCSIQSEDGTDGMVSCRRGECRHHVIPSGRLAQPGAMLRFCPHGSVGGRATLHAATERPLPKTRAVVSSNGLLRVPAAVR